jgi:hypothetical protein
LSLCVALNLISGRDQATLGAALAQMVVAVSAILAGAQIVLKYIESRTDLKVGKWSLVLLATLTLVGSSRAQYALPYRNAVEQRLRALEQAQRQAVPMPPPADPGVGQALQQLAANQQALANLLERQMRQPVLGPVLQQIPLGGPPLQTIPLGGPPKQEIPLGSPPLQNIPLGSQPPQQIPLGGPPLQQIDSRPPAQTPPPLTTPRAAPPNGTQQIPPDQVAPMTPPAKTRWIHALWTPAG